MENELGDFLRAHRARLTPREAGITSFGVRRVPGLRREELAQLAGVSPTYYMRLEQGQATNASASVIDALARALRLNGDETSYLRRIAAVSAHPGPGTCDASGENAGAASGGDADDASGENADDASGENADDLPTGILRLLDTMPDAAALVLSPINDVLACNDAARELFFAHLDPKTRWNTHRLLFSDPFTQGLFRDWDAEAELAVASLRFHAAEHHDDPAFHALVGDLLVHSAAFARLWADHPVTRCTRGTKQLRHPRVGPFDLDYELLHFPDDNGLRLIVYSASAGTPGAGALRSLLGAAPPLLG